MLHLENLWRNSLKQQHNMNIFLFCLTNFLPDFDLILLSLIPKMNTKYKYFNGFTFHYHSCVDSRFSFNTKSFSLKMKPFDNSVKFGWIIIIWFRFDNTKKKKKNRKERKKRRFKLSFSGNDWWQFEFVIPFKFFSLHMREFEVPVYKNFHHNINNNLLDIFQLMQQRATIQEKSLH